MTIRLLGLAGILGGACLTAIEIRALVTTGAGPHPATMDRLDDALYALWSLGVICSFLALVALRATGTNAVMRLAPFIPIAGFAAMIIASILDIVGVMGPATNPVAGVAWILILLGTLIVAIFALVARTWPGWRKFTPLICLLVIPVMLAGGPAAAPLFGLSWVVLGYAVLTSTASVSFPHRSEAPA